MTKPRDPAVAANDPRRMMRANKDYRVLTEKERANRQRKIAEHARKINKTRPDTFSTVPSDKNEMPAWMRDRSLLPKRPPR